MSCLRSNLVSGGLGFRSARCLPCLCPLLPLFQVRICFQVNSVTQVAIQQGTQSNAVTSGALSFDVSSPPQVSYQPGITEDSWGKSCRNVVWDRSIQGDRFVRIRVCPASDCSTCADVPLSCSGAAIPNVLQVFSVNAQDLVLPLTALAQDVQTAGVPATAGLSSITCNAGCTSVYPLCGLGAGSQFPSGIQFGTEIVVGPLNALTPLLALA